MASKEKENHRNSLPPGQAPIKKLSRWGIDHPGIARSNPKIDLNTYTLTGDGEVEKPLRLNWKEITELPAIRSTSGFRCVEGWSVLNCEWEGIRFRDFAGLAKPKQSARFVTFECADGYTTSLSLPELLGDDILLAMKL